MRQAVIFQLTVRAIIGATEEGQRCGTFGIEAVILALPPVWRLQFKFIKVQPEVHRMYGTL